MQAVQEKNKAGGILGLIERIDQTAFFLLGDLVEYGNTEEMFSQPKDQRTEDYITGRFG